MDYKVDVIRNECVEKLKQEYRIKIGEGHPLPEKLSMKQKLDAISGFFYCVC